MLLLCSTAIVWQVSDKERELEYQTLFRDVASILAEKCVNSQSNRPFTISMLERAMKDLHVSVDPKRSAKQQALEVRQHARSHDRLACFDCQ